MLEKQLKNSKIWSQRLHSLSNPINGHLYVTCVKDNSLTVIDTKTYEKIADLKLGKAPYGVTVSDDGKRFYVVNQNENTLVEFNAGSLQITQTIKTEKNAGKR